jgi:universal stress protein A
MKFKPTDKAGGLVVELAATETQLPTSNAAEKVTALPVFKLKKILVPLDFSDCSKKALQYAIPFAKQFDADLTLLHVLRPYPPMLEMSPVDVESIGDTKAALEGFRRTIDDAIRSRTAIRRGDPPVEIIDVAMELGIDLIILSTHGHTGVARVLMGSTTEKVVRHAGCPVLVVREHEHEFVKSRSES